jgi:hypothetical protein
MSVTKYYSFHSEIEKCSYSELANQITPQAFYVFELLRRHSVSAPFTFEQIERASLNARRFHTGALLERCLLELEQAKCLVVEERHTAKSD